MILRESYLASHEGNLLVKVRDYALSPEEKDLPLSSRPEIEFVRVLSGAGTCLADKSEADTLPGGAVCVSRPVRWDSDHVVIFDDELKEITKEIIRNDATEKILISLDFFEASINRISAWVVETRNMQKTLLFVLLRPDMKAPRMRGTLPILGLA